MTGTESRALKVGNRVMWKGDKTDLGVITETTWDNREQQSVLHNDMGSVTKI